MKQYKTNEELLEYLESKNVIIKNKTSALKKLEKYTYYSIINSYKYNFKDSNNNYLPNVSFEEIYALYEFDKNLKLIMLKYALEVESLIKSLMSNHISNIYGVEDYLNANNLDNKANLMVRKKLIDKINEDINHNYGIHLAITHYKDNYGFVPPFVLTKILTFGVISSYYGLLKQSDRQIIAKKFKISDALLKQILKCLTNVRNICAHNDRLFCYRDKYTLKFKEIDTNYVIKDNLTNLYMMIRAMQIILDKWQYNSLVKAIEKEIKKLDNKLNSIDIKNILRIMGYPNV